MKKFILHFLIASIFASLSIVLTSMKFVTVDMYLNATNPLTKVLFYFATKQAFYVAVILASLLSLQVYFSHFIYPLLLNSRLKKTILRNVLRRISADLLQGDEENNRVTLFKEIGWMRAFFHNIYCILLHCTRKKFRKRVVSYLKNWPGFSNHLIVYDRRANQFKKSTAKFAVEENELKDCDGVAGFVRFRRTIVNLPNLPDINEINLFQYKNRFEMPADEEEKVSEYMQKGFIQNFDKLKQIHRKAVHFLGVPITARDGRIWGVLLIDSILETSPFSDVVEARFASFAQTLEDVV